MEMREITFKNVDRKSLLILQLAILTKKHDYENRANKSIAPEYRQKEFLECADICQQFLEQLKLQQEF